MRYLFVVQRYHYLRNFDPVIRRLVADGHTVIIGIQDRDDPSRPEVADFVRLLRRDLDRVFVVRVPDRRSRHALFCDQMRLLRDHARFHLPGLEGAVKPARRVRDRLLPRLRQRTRQPSWRTGPEESLRETLLAALEAITPVDPEIRRCLRKIAPDVLFVTPMVSLGSCQVDFVAAAQDLGIPSVLGVASWDNLTNKGLIKLWPDRVLVWNEQQKAEAVALHGMPDSRIVVTGAQLFDEWFEKRPSRDRAAFCARLGLDPNRPFILYIASSIFIHRNEAEFVLRWLDRLAGARQPALRQAQVVIRPYPRGPKVTDQWSDPRIRSRANVVVYPSTGRLPLLEADRADYFDSLHHCAAVVGINTSGMLEAGILGRPCFTLKSPELRESQDGMPHFSHLVSHGFVTPSDAIQSHLRQLAWALDPERLNPERADVEGFLRPHGSAVPATPFVIRALTEMLEAPAAKRLPRIARRGARWLGWPLFLAARLWFELRVHKPPNPHTWLLARAEAVATYDTGRWLGRRRPSFRGQWIRKPVRNGDLS